MPPSVEDLTEQARALPPTDILKLVDALMLQLDLPDSRLEGIWAEEVNKRRQAYLAGKLTSRPYEEVMQRFRVQ